MSCKKIFKLASIAAGLKGEKLSIEFLILFIDGGSSESINHWQTQMKWKKEVNKDKKFSGEMIQK